MRRQVLAFGRTFSITAWADDDFMTQHPLRAGWLMLLVGLVMTLALGVVVSHESGRRDALEREVARRTVALRQSEEHHRLLFTRSPDAYLIIDQGLFTDCNEAALRMLGATRDQVLGHSADALSFALQPGGERSSELAARYLHRHQGFIMLILPRD